MNGRKVRIRIVVTAGVMLLTAGGAAAQSQVFRRAQRFALAGMVGDNLPTAVVADVGSPDGPPDHIPDVITANSNPLALVLFGTTDGTLRTAPSTPLGMTPTALAVADFDGDSIPDLLIANTANNVSFFRGNPDGPPFDHPGAPIAAGTNPTAIVVADLNNDHRLDAIVVDEGSTAGAVTILLGNGDGTFSEFGSGVVTGIGSRAGAVGDFNRDGKLDVAVANSQSNDVSILRGDGSGGFTKVQTIAVAQEPVAIIAQDINGDSRLDLVVTNRNSDSIAVLNGLASGGFSEARFFRSGSDGSSPTGLALADVNLDGKLDAVVPNRRSSDVSVLLGDGAGSFAAPRAFVADQEPEAVVIADFNTDGLPDVVAVTQGSQAPDAAVLLSRGDGSLLGVEDVVTQPSPTSVVAGDIDNDGLPDLAVAHSSGAVLVYPAEQMAGFAAPATLHAAGDAVALARGDFNADGLLDLAAVNKSTSNVSVFLGRVAGGFAAVNNYPIGDGATGVVAADWNHDGRIDLAVIRQPGTGTGMVDILLANADGSFRAPVSFAVGSTPVAIDCGDFNKDAKLDIATANNVSNDVSILMGNGDGTFQAALNKPSAGGPKALAVGDFDHDGFDDIAVGLSMNRSVSILYGNGHGIFQVGPSLPVDNSPSAIAARDLSGDSIADLLVTDEVANVVGAYISGGSNRRFQSDSSTVNLRPISVVAADFDGDGRYDGAAADSFVAGSVSVLTNIRAVPTLRGDGNGDGEVSAADIVAVLRELSDGRGTRIEQVSGGTYQPNAGVDANGDGLVTPQDVRATAHRLFPGV